MSRNRRGFNRSDTKGLPSKTKLDAAEQELHALAVYWDGGACDENRVAEELGVSVPQARVLINRGEARYFRERTDELDELRGRALIELEMLRKVLFKDALTGSDKAARSLLRLQERASKLVGLDAQVDDPRVSIVMVNAEQRRAIQEAAAANPEEWAQAAAMMARVLREEEGQALPETVDAEFEIVDDDQGDQ